MEHLLAADVLLGENSPQLLNQFSSHLHIFKFTFLI